MNQRPKKEEYAEFNQNYMELVSEEGGFAEVLQEQSEAAFALFEGLTEEQGGTGMPRKNGALSSCSAI